MENHAKTKNITETETENRVGRKNHNKTENCTEKKNCTGTENHIATGKHTETENPPGFNSNTLNTVHVPTGSEHHCMELSFTDHTPNVMSAIRFFFTSQ